MTTCTPSDMASALIGSAEWQLGHLRMTSWSSVPVEGTEIAFIANILATIIAHSLPIDVNAGLTPAPMRAKKGLEEAKTGIRFENVGLRYGLGPEVLRDVSVHIAPGSFQYVTGPSGTGKTSLLRLLFLSLQPTRGLLQIFGEDASTIKRETVQNLRKRIGIVFQDFRLLDHLTTYENVALPLRVSGMPEADYRNDVTELLEWVGLGDRMWVHPQVLSGGEKQRAAIARALITKPEILLADEPTGNVDPPLARRLLRLFIELNRLGTSVVIATHDLALMEQHSARRLVLNDGHVDVYQTPGE
jgi:cell division transport system ATP-binding protein